MSKPNTTETVHELVVTKAANTNTFGHQYIAVTTKKERVLLQTNLSQRQLKPQIIIADGSNYPSFVGRWKATAKQETQGFTALLQRVVIP